jgi:hypothetical protein
LVFQHESYLTYSFILGASLFTEQLSKVKEQIKSVSEENNAELLVVGSYLELLDVRINYISTVTSPLSTSEENTNLLSTEPFHQDRML